MRMFSRVSHEGDYPSTPNSRTYAAVFVSGANKRNDYRYGLNCVRSMSLSRDFGQVLPKRTVAAPIASLYNERCDYVFIERTG